MPDVTIRFYRLEDAQPLLEAALESVSEAGPWMPWCHTGLTVEDIRGWIESQIAEREAGTAFEFAVQDTTGAYLGGCGLNNINAERRFANLGFWVRSSMAGRSVAPEAVRAVARWAFSNTELERLEIVCAVGNTRSQRVAEKAGAHREGVLQSRLFLHGRPHDAVLYSIVSFNDVPALGCQSLDSAIY
jgi:RimJ/RimL family protein N-acetyltransferase